MKILYPILHYPPVIGGLEQWSQNIAERQPSGTEILIVTGRVRGVPNFEDRGNVRILRTSLFELRDLSHSSVVYIAGAFPLIVAHSLWLSQKIDLFHCHGFVSAVMGFALSVARRKPYICTEQSIKLRNPFLKLLARLVYKKAAVCIASSRAVAEEFRKIGVGKIEIIPNGVAAEKFSRERCLKCAGFDPAHVRGRTPHINILAVGRLEKVKGHKYLLDAFAHVKREIPEAKLTLVGDGSERANLEKQADRLGVRGYVEFVGEIPHDELPSWYHKADIFVMPSLSEGFGITAIEAMASGIPVIMTNAGGLIDIVRDGETGIQVRVGDSRMLASAIVNLIGDKNTRVSVADAARQSVEDYSWDKIALRVEALYRTLRKRDIKILIATGIFPPDIGGPATYVENLATELNRRNFNVAVITYADSGRREVADREYNFPVYRISRRYPWGIRHLVYFFRLLISAISSDVMYAQNTTSAGFPCLFISKLFCKRFVIKIVGDVAWERANDRGLVSDSIEVFQSKRYGFKTEFLRAIEKHVAKQSAGIIVPSMYLKNIVKQWGVADDKIYVIYNSFNLPHGRRKEMTKKNVKLRLKLSGDIILTVGRLIPLKCFGEIIEIMPFLLRYNHRFTLVIIGDGPLIENFKLKIKKLGLENRVRLLGAIEYSKIHLYFRAANIFVLNSIHEGFPHVILEAMFFGAPIVATRVGGIPEMIENNREGFLVDSNNREALQTKILELHRDKKLQNKFIVNGYRKLNKFRSENMISATLRVLTG